MASHFEAKLHGFRRTQDGVVISYVVHPSDLSADMALAALGTRYMVAFEPIGDDEKRLIPENRAGHLEETDPKNPTVRRPFSELKLSQQAGIRCGDAQFAMFLMDAYPETAAKFTDAADVVRALCCRITSRKQLDTEAGPAEGWLDLEIEYQQWLTDKRYKDSYR